MKILVPKETASGENRVAITPDVAKKYVKLGCEVTVQKGAGDGAGFSDDAYRDAGASIAVKMDTHVGNADIVLRLNKPSVDDVKAMKKGSIHISYMDPLNDHDLLKAFQDAGVSGISMEFVPRTTLAQKMDALSSQANLGGYVAVLMGANNLPKVMPMLMTPAGTIPPSRAFIIGAGVAGLQAIATAKRLGARVEAFDTRPSVKEQVESLGAKFVEIDLGEMGETDQGYAKELTPEQLAKQQEVMAKRAAAADLVITTAQVFGRKAPVIIKKEMLDDFKPGAIVVDMAVATGGNVEGSKLNETVTLKNGVKIIGTSPLANEVPSHASLMYAANLYNMIEHFWNKEDNKFELKIEDEIIDGCLIVHEGEVRNEMVKKSME
jgi:NAD(P) transhydrogenase subunit alpha